MNVFLFIVIFLLIILAFLLVFLKIHPTFGGISSKEQRKVYIEFNNFVNGKFVNQVPTKMNMSLSNIFSMLKDSLFRNKNRNPADLLPIADIDWNQIRSEEDSLTWFGHSAFLLSIDNLKILVDPMLGSIASPISFAGSKRFTAKMLNIIDNMPSIDAVFITHDHYDHLDYSSIMKLKEKVSHFLVPHGVGAHLIRWGISKERITELNWWDEIEFKGLNVALVPSKHFSGRGITNKDTTLWGGWVILGRNTRFYTSGDGGYDEHFKEIGKKYGPFDVALIEGGQYDWRWPWVHMTPEEAIQAHIDVNGKDMMLIHWGAFALAYHGWAEPVERAIKEAEIAGVSLFAPKIGETVPLPAEITVPIAPWWKN